MIRLIRTEIMKLKGSYMVLVGMAGSATVPLLVFIILLTNRQKTGVVPTMAVFFRQVLMFDSLLIGFMLYGLIISYVFNREFQEDTLKSILPVPVGRTALISAKLIVVTVWVTILMVVTAVLTVVLGLVAGFNGLSVELFLESLSKFTAMGLLITLLSTPVIFLSLVFKNYVVGIAFTIIITIMNIVAVQSEYGALFPWSAPAEIVMWEDAASPYPLWVPWIVLTITSAACIAASLLFFNRRDIQ